MRRLLLPLAVLVLSWLPATASAQPIGTFRWRLEPHCNVLTLSVVRSGDTFSLQGTDNQCGLKPAAAVVGTAHLNPDGKIGMGLTIVVSPEALPLHIAASVSPPTFSGDWHDSAGNSGAMQFTASTVAGGELHSATTGTIGATLLPPSQVQRRAEGRCPFDQFMTGVTEGGTIRCEPGGVGTISTIVGHDGIDVRQLVGERLSLRWSATESPNGLLLLGGGGPNPGAFLGGIDGFMWHPGRSAFVAGEAMSTLDADIGIGSVALGRSSQAVAPASVTLGSFAETQASALGSVVIGGTASGVGSVAIVTDAGRPGAQTGGQGAIAIGQSVRADGQGSVVLGRQAEALAPGAFVYGDRVTPSGARVKAEANQFVVRTFGRVTFRVPFSLPTPLPLPQGVFLNDGGWEVLSDRRVKHAFRTLPGADILRRLAALPIREWSYKTEPAGIRHVGPTAQDFHAAFHLGDSNRFITQSDADGIALRALQAIDTRTQSLGDAQQRRAREIARLRERLDRLEARVSRGATKR